MLVPTAAPTPRALARWVAASGTIGGLAWIAAALIFSLGLSWLAVALGAAIVGLWALVWSSGAAASRWPLLLVGQWLSIAAAHTASLVAAGHPLDWPTLGWSGVLAAGILGFWMIPVAILRTSLRSPKGVR